MLPTVKSCRSEPSIMLSQPRQGRCRKSPVVSKATYPGAGDNVAKVTAESIRPYFKQSKDYICIGSVD
jgi:hypothetical protein